MDRHRALAAALDSRQAAVPPRLLDNCRGDLMAAIQGGAPRAVRPEHKSPWTLFLEAMAAHASPNFGRFRQPVGALALVALGILRRPVYGCDVPRR